MGTFGDRLREERERLGVSQAALGELGGVRKQAQLKYEGNARQPDSAYLGRIARYGVDVLYLLTGQRADSNHSRANDLPSAPKLSDGDRILLDNFHAAPAQVQAGIKTTLGAFAPATVSHAEKHTTKHVFKGNVGRVQSTQTGDINNTFGTRRKK